MKWWLLHPLALLRRIRGEFFYRFHPDLPWISPAAIEFCERHLHTQMNALEWGSGRSTLWFARKVRELTSVEHVDTWFEQVSEKLRLANAANVQFLRIELDHPESAPTTRDYAQLPRYVAAINRFTADSLDFVVVDGHYRLACVQAAQEKIRPGGYLLVDNTDWMPLAGWGVPTDWKIVHRSLGYQSETTIWQKPLTNS